MTETRPSPQPGATSPPTPAPQPPAKALAALLLAGAAWSCAPAPETAGPAAPAPEERAARFARQIEEGRERPAWESWYQALAEHNGEYRLAEFLLFPSSERVLHDQALIDRLNDTSALGDPSRLQGPLVMITDVARQLEAKGVDLLLVPVPPRSAVFPDRIGIDAPLAAGETPPLLDWRLRTFYQTLAELGVEVVDALPAFLEGRTRTIEATAEGAADASFPFEETVFRRKDMHWTTYGAGLVARAVGERIRAYPWFEEAAAAQGRASLVETVEWGEQRGNLGMKLVEAGLLEPGSPKERYRIRQVRVEGEEESGDDRDSPVLLIGDSFCLPEHGLPDHLLEELGFRVDRVSISGGYLSSMLQALRMRDDGLAGKRLVVWVFGYYSLNRWGQWTPTPIY